MTGHDEIDAAMQKIAPILAPLERSSIAGILCGLLSAFLYAHRGKTEERTQELRVLVLSKIITATLENLNDHEELPN